MKQRIYLDYAALTPIDSRVSDEMKKYASAAYANPSAWYGEGVAAKKAMEDGRKQIADFLHARPGEVIFTASGTEANNLALLGVVEALRSQGVPYLDMHVLVSAIEHSSVIECANYLSDREVTVESIPVDKHGIVKLDELEKKIRPNTVVVSIMTVNNEIGTIQPIREIAKIVRQAREKPKAQKKPLDFQSFSYPIFHTDAAQAILYEELYVERLSIDLLTLDASKAYGPRGIGALYVKKGTPLAPIIHGGGQEQGLRSGTENLPAIGGFAKALEIAAGEREKEGKRVAWLRDYFLESLLRIDPKISVNPKAANDQEARPISPHILNVSIPRINNEFFVIQLDARGIACSTKSSCLRDAEESYVLRSIGADSRSSVRFSFGRSTRKADIDGALKAIESVLRG